MPQKSAGKIFLSYRLGDVSAVAEQLRHSVEKGFGSAVQLLDVHDIPAGTDIMPAIDE